MNSDGQAQLLFLAALLALLAFSPVGALAKDDSDPAKIACMKNLKRYFPAQFRADYKNLKAAGVEECAAVTDLWAGESNQGQRP